MPNRVLSNFDRKSSTEFFFIRSISIDDTVDTRDSSCAHFAFSSFSGKFNEIKRIDNNIKFKFNFEFNTFHLRFAFNFSAVAHSRSKRLSFFLCRSLFRIQFMQLFEHLIRFWWWRIHTIPKTTQNDMSNQRMKRQDNFYSVVKHIPFVTCALRACKLIHFDAVNSLTVFRSIDLRISLSMCSTRSARFLFCWGKSLSVHNFSFNEIIRFSPIFRSAHLFFDRRFSRSAFCFASFHYSIKLNNFPCR